MTSLHHLCSQLFQTQNNFYESGTLVVSALEQRKRHATLPNFDYDELVAIPPWEPVVCFSSADRFEMLWQILSAFRAVWNALWFKTRKPQSLNSWVPINHSTKRYTWTPRSEADTLHTSARKKSGPYQVQVTLKDGINDSSRPRRRSGDPRAQKRALINSEQKIKMCKITLWVWNYQEHWNTRYKDHISFLFCYTV